MPGENAKLLVIDDEPKMLQSLKFLFEGEGYEVHLAESGAEGEKLFRQHSFALVLTDLMMPDEWHRSSEDAPTD